MPLYTDPVSSSGSSAVAAESVSQYLLWTAPTTVNILFYLCKLWTRIYDTAWDDTNIGVGSGGFGPGECREETLTVGAGSALRIPVTNTSGTAHTLYWHMVGVGIGLDGGSTTIAKYNDTLTGNTTYTGNILTTNWAKTLTNTPNQADYLFRVHGWVGMSDNAAAYRDFGLIQQHGRARVNYILGHNQPLIYAPTYNAGAGTVRMDYHFNITGIKIT